MAFVFSLFLNIVIAVAIVTFVGAEEVDIAVFRQAVLDSYDDNSTFQANLVDILAILCPVSVYCPGDSRREERPLSSSPLPQSQHNMSTEILLAREIVKQKTGRLGGCCEPCNCLPTCSERNNCCPTYPREAIQMTDVNQTCSLASVWSIIDGYRKPKPYPFYGFSYYMVTDCFHQDNAHVQEETLDKCRNPNITHPDEVTPIYNEDTKRIYRNKFCAQCNNDVNSMTAWDVVVTAPPNYAPMFNDSPANLYKKAIDLISVKVDILFQPPTSMAMIEEDYLCVNQPPVIQKSDFTDGNGTSFLERACFTYKSSKYHTTTLMYSNVFCFLLSDARFRTTERTCAKPGWKFGYTSFTAILSVHANDEDKVNGISAATKNDAKQCSCVQHFDRANGQCRDVLCPFGYFRKGCACRILIRVISGIKVKLYAEVLSDTTYKTTFHDVLKNKSFFTAVEKKLSSIIGEQCGSVATIALVKETSDLDPDFYKATTLLIITIDNGHDTRTLLQELSTRLQACVSFEFLRHHLGLTFGISFAIHADVNNHTLAITRNKLFPTNHSVETVLSTIHEREDLSSIKHYPTLSPSMFCEYIKLNPTEVENLVLNSKATGYTPAKLSQIYNAEDSTMCADDFNAIFNKSPSTLRLVNSLFFACLILSLSF